MTSDPMTGDPMTGDPMTGDPGAVRARVSFDVVAARAPALVSPDWVRISGASAIALGLASGRFSRQFAFGGINLLLNYEDGCRSDCAYCGLARTRPGAYEDKSFIRVDWPLVETDRLVERMAVCQHSLTGCASPWSRAPTPSPTPVTSPGGSGPRWPPPCRSWWPHRR